MVDRLLIRTLPLLALSMFGASRVAGAQFLAERGSIAVSAQVLPVATFEGGETHTLTVRVVPGTSVSVSPQDGVRTRMTYNAATRVVVTGSTLSGPGGAVLIPQLLCAHGDADGVIAESAFDCGAGYLAPLVGGLATSMPLGVGATVAATATRGLPAGLYVGSVTLIAVQSGF